MRRYSSLLLLLWLMTGAAIAQDDNNATCAAAINAAFTQTADVCADLAAGTLCYGNGNVRLTTPDVLQTPDTIGQQRNFTDLLRVRTQPTPDAYGIARLALPINITEDESVTLDVLVYGDASLRRVQDLPEADTEAAPTEDVSFTITAIDAVNVRNRPSTDGAIIGVIYRNNTATAIGRNADNTWLQVAWESPGVPEAWVFAQLFDVEGLTATLPVLSEQIGSRTTPQQVASDRLYLRSGSDDSPCESAPQSGILIQHPGEGLPATFTLNEVRIRMNGTIFVQSQDAGNMALTTLSGITRLDVNGSLQYVPAGTQIAVPVDVGSRVTGEVSPLSAADSTRTADLPVAFLANPVEITVPADDATLEAYTERVPLAGTWRVSVDSCFEELQGTEFDLRFSEDGNMIVNDEGIYAPQETGIYRRLDGNWTAYVISPEQMEFINTEDPTCIALDDLVDPADDTANSDADSDEAADNTDD